MSPRPGDDDARERIARANATRQAVSVGVATGLYGVSFGALATASGLSVVQAVVLSLVLFSGGSQFALVGILGAGGSAASAVTTSTLLATRNAFYALRTAQILDVRGWRALVGAHLTIDETTAVGTAQPTQRSQQRGFWWTGLIVFTGWNLTTFIGAVLGDALGDPRSWGLDAAASAAFVALLWPRLSNAPARVVAGLAAAIALGSAPWLPTGVPVIASLIAAVGVSWWVTSRSAAS